jgi:hypothetical protein
LFTLFHHWFLLLYCVGLAKSRENDVACFVTS